METALSLSSDSLLGEGTASSIDVLYNQLQSRVSQEVAAKQEEINTSLQDAYDEIGARENQLINVKGSILNAQTAFNHATDALDDVVTQLQNMREQASDAIEDNEYARNKFDLALNLINIKVDSYEPDLNPIGNVDKTDWSPNTVTYRTDTIAATKSLTGTYAGADFTITTSDGTVWRPEEGTNILQKIDTDGDIDTTLSTSMTTGIELSAYDEDTGEITISVRYAGDEDPISVTGSLERAGLGIMPSWFYRSQNSIDAGLPAMSTAEDVQLAMDDIDTAMINVTVANSVISAGTAQVDSSMGIIDRQLDDLSSEKKAALEENIEARQDLQTEVQSQYQVMLLNLSQAASVQQQYANIFAGVTARNPFLSVTT